MAKKATLLWLDLEMTGLDQKGDLILEAAVIATDWDFKEIARQELIIKHSETLLREKFAKNAAFWDENVASRDGLLLQNGKGQSPAQVEDAILAFIDTHFSKKRPVILAGNSIHIDRRFITTQWPRFDTRLHYRMLDVSAWKVVFEGKYKKKYAKAEEHRALGDIRGSIEELQYYLKKFKI